MKYKSAEEMLQDWLLTMTGNSYDCAHYWDDILSDAILNYGCKLDGLEVIRKANVKPLMILKENERIIRNVCH